jgi:hypothetical protein
LTTDPSLNDTRLAGVNLTDAAYAPASPPPDAYVADIQGLRTVVFPKGLETGLVQLRDLLQKAGLRDLERQATYAIERGKTWYLLNLFNYWQSVHPRDTTFQKALDGVIGFDLVGLGQAVLYHPQVLKSAFHHWGGVAEGLFRLVGFDLTTGYGLYPSRALLIIFVFWVALTFVYVLPIRLPPRYPSPAPAAGVYRIWPSDRIEVVRREVKLSASTKVERLQAKGWHALGYAAHFSLLSAFHIGWRDLNVGTWISRIQPREYALRATGWVRVVSGLQSLLSVYLLAIWALTYFGRPFQ